MHVDELVDRALTLLRSRGERVTAPRRRVVAALASLEGHPDLTAIHTAAQSLGGSHLATTYRTLEHLSSHGVVAHVHLDHGPPRFHFSAAVTGVEHAHAVCRRCARVFDLPADVLDGARAHLQSLGCRPHLEHAALSVTCGSCETDDQTPASSLAGEGDRQLASAAPVRGPAAR